MRRMDTRCTYTPIHTYDAHSKIHAQHALEHWCMALCHNRQQRTRQWRPQDSARHDIHQIQSTIYSARSENPPILVPKVKKVRHKGQSVQKCTCGALIESLPPTSGTFVQLLTLQMPLPSKYLPVTGGHLVTAHVCLPSNMNLSCMNDNDGAHCVLACSRNCI